MRRNSQRLFEYIQLLGLTTVLYNSNHSEGGCERKFKQKAGALVARILPHTHTHMHNGGHDLGAPDFTCFGRIINLQIFCRSISGFECTPCAKISGFEGICVTIDISL